ncbi:hypothetical protein BDR07DRAFT_1429528, partial [Suillus spraguei]
MVQATKLIRKIERRRPAKKLSDLVKLVVTCSQSQQFDKNNEAQTTVERMERSGEVDTCLVSSTSILRDNVADQFTHISLSRSATLSRRMAKAPARVRKVKEP